LLRARVMGAGRALTWRGAGPREFDVGAESPCSPDAIGLGVAASRS
jgi:hypothetical protein